MDPKKNFIQNQENAPKGAEPAQESADNASLHLDTGVSTRIKETVGELPAETAQTSGQSKQARPVTLSAEERKAKLLAELPQNEAQAEVKMRKDIENVVEKKLHTLESSVKSVKNPYKLSLIMRDIHQLRDVLAEIAAATFEYLKTLWLRLVHGLAV